MMGFNVGKGHTFNFSQPISAFLALSWLNLLGNLYRLYYQDVSILGGNHHTAVILHCEESVTSAEAVAQGVRTESGNKL